MQFFRFLQAGHSTGSVAILALGVHNLSPSPRGKLVIIGDHRTGQAISNNPRKRHEKVVYMMFHLMFVARPRPKKTIKHVFSFQLVNICKNEVTRSFCF